MSFTIIGRRIWGQVTSTEDIAEMVVIATAIPINGDGDRTADVAHTVRAAEHLVNGTARDIDTHIAADIGRHWAGGCILVAVAAAEYHACDDAAIDVHIGAVHIGCVTAAVDIAGDGGVALVDHVYHGRTRYVTGIAAAVDVASDSDHV